MAFCRNCGHEVEDNATVCMNCGTAQQQQTPPVVDNGGFGWGLLGCCVPIVGLILFLVWKDTKPKTAKAAGVGALVCAIAYVFIYVVFFAFGIGMGLAGM